ncbi:hypothetical protein [Micromonospora coerulea]|uniref:hypothetical protein n=1 Tax=Micromonospora coerulea TaxID=47856 RepID=UPI0019049C2E|nr:hypothetical protein [Micromonospora veneta]
MRWLLLILAGGTGTPLAVFLVARLLVERHADTTAAAIRREHARAQLAERPKELTR